MIMTDHLMGPFVRRFLLEDLVADRNLSPNTQKSYRDTIRLLFSYVAEHHKTDPVRIADFRGRYPYESGWNCGSTSGSRYILTTVWAILSATVGMPKRRSLPSFFGIPTVRTGGGKYVPDDIRFQIR